jgi:hypothetical protein
MSKFKKGDLIVDRFNRELVHVVISAPGEVVFLFRGTQHLWVYLVKRTLPDSPLLCVPAKELEADFIPLLEAYSSYPPAAHRP